MDFNDRRSAHCGGRTTPRERMRVFLALILLCLVAVTSYNCGGSTEATPPEADFVVDRFVIESDACFEGRLEYTADEGWDTSQVMAGSDAAVRIEARAITFGFQLPISVHGAADAELGTDPHAYVCAELAGGALFEWCAEHPETAEE